MKTKINKELLLKCIKDGHVISQKHPYLDLTIYNYSQFVQYEKAWNEVTLMCRGLILNSNYEIVQRPFGKFFNIDEHDSEYLEDIPNLPFEVYDKLDGSLGILYWDDFLSVPTPFIASRGSFTSEQANKATQMLHTKYMYNWDKLDPTKTYIFEIIYPENRIVIDYGNSEQLVLLAIIDTQTGIDLPLVDIGFPIVKSYDGIKDFKTLKNLNLENKEGFVIKFIDNTKPSFRVKSKFDEYCRLHRIITNVTSYDIWECLRHETGFDEMLDKVPDEFYDWVKDCKNTLQNEFDNLKLEWISRYDSGKHLTDQKEFALWAKQWKDSGILFTLRNGKTIDETIWKKVKPSYQKPFSSK